MSEIVEENKTVISFDIYKVNGFYNRILGTNFQSKREPFQENVIKYECKYGNYIYSFSHTDTDQPNYQQMIEETDKKYTSKNISSLISAVILVGGLHVVYYGGKFIIKKAVKAWKLWK
jgi:hypothetical protein